MILYDISAYMYIYICLHRRVYDVVDLLTVLFAMS